MSKNVDDTGRDLSTITLRCNKQGEFVPHLDACIRKIDMQGICMYVLARTCMYMHHLAMPSAPHLQVMDSDYLIIKESKDGIIYVSLLGQDAGKPTLYATTIRTAVVQVLCNQCTW
jgi:hypothetical protein